MNIPLWQGSVTIFNQKCWVIMIFLGRHVCDLNFAPNLIPHPQLNFQLVSPSKILNLLRSRSNKPGMRIRTAVFSTLGPWSPEKDISPYFGLWNAQLSIYIILLSLKSKNTLQSSIFPGIFQGNMTPRKWHHIPNQQSIHSCVNFQFEPRSQLNWLLVHQFSYFINFLS